MRQTLDTLSGHPLSDQQAAALELRQDGLIAAGAGSGKTTVMAAIACRDLLVDGLDPAQILVCTFTRAAASNLRERISARLLGLIDAGLADADLLERSSEMWIGTIDAISARFLREHALAAGLSPGFRVADERLLWPLKRAALDHALDALPAQELARLARALDAGPRLQAELLRAYEALRTAGQDPAHYELADAGPLDEVFARDGSLAALSASERATIPAANELLARLEELLSQAQAELPTGKGERLLSCLRQDRDAIAAGDPWSFSGQTYGSVIKASAALWDEAKALKPELDRVRSALATPHTRPERAAFAALLRGFAAHYQAAKQTAELLDFFDLATNANALLHDPSNSFSGFARVYIDEAQDTNPQQLALLNALRATQPGVEPGVGIAVGDAAQSIYAFRRADVQGFREQRAKAQGAVVELPENYRSHAEVLHAINAICARIPELDGDVLMMDPGRPDTETQTTESSHEQRVCALLLGDADSTPKAIDEARAVIPHLEEAIKAGHKRDGSPLSWRDVCVLCRTNTDAMAYTEALREAGIPALLIQSRGLMAREECQDVLAYLKLLANPESDSALVRVLSSPFVGASDQQLQEIFEARRQAEHQTASAANPPLPAVSLPLLPFAQAALPSFTEAYAGLARAVGHKSPTALIRAAIEAHGFDLALEVIDQTGGMWRNVEKLLALIDSLQRNYDGNSLEAIILRLEIESEGDIDEGQDARLPDELDAARVMTIHAAKGLEFPLVVVGRLGRQPGSNSHVFWVGHDGSLGAQLRGVRDTAAEAEKQRADVVDEAEERRLTYVALTRAEDYLFLAASAKLNKDGTPSWRGPAKWLLTDAVGLRALPPIGAPEILTLEDRGHSTSLEIRSLLAQAPPGAQGPPALTGGQALDLPDESPHDELRPATGLTSYSALASEASGSHNRHELSADASAWLDGDDSFVPRPRRSDALGFGLRMHEILAQTDWSKDQDATTLADRLPPPEQERGRQAFERLLGSDIYQRLRHAEILGSEEPFVFLSNEHGLVSGVVDLRGRDEQGYFIVDWKTGEEMSGGESSEDPYALQQQLYREAVLAGPEGVDTVDLIWHYLERE